MTNVYGWLCLVLALLGTGVIVGVLLNNWWAGQREEALKRGEARLHAETQALHTAQRLYTEMLRTRQAMQEEAIRQQRRPTL